MIKPDKSLILICLEISSAASRLVSNAVLSTFFCFIELPELISIDTKASVGFITIHQILILFLYHRSGLIFLQFFL
jgi:hypothetical protein